MRSFALLFLALAACGGSVSSDPGPAPDPYNPPVHDDTMAPVGDFSKLLVFDTVTRSDGSAAPSGVPLPSVRASIGNQARVDFTAAYDLARAPAKASVAPRFGNITDVTADFPGTKMTLSGKMTFSSQGETNEWSTITLDRNADGSLTGTFSAVGQLEVIAGDVGDSYGVVGTGHLEDDKLAPELRLAPPTASRGGEYLPWDKLYIQFGEPLAAVDIEEALGGVAWAPSDNGLRNWNTSVIGTATELKVGAFTLSGPDSKVVDPSGNPIAAFSAPIAFRDLGAIAVAPHALDQNQGTMWGGVTYSFRDARCENANCVIFPAAGANECTVAPGFAGTIGGSSGAVHTAHARVKVLAADSFPGSTSAPPVYNPIRLEVASGGAPAVTGNLSSNLEFTRTADDADLPWSTAWQTIDIQLPNPLVSYGFAFVRPTCESLGGLPFPDSTVSVLVSDVWTD